MRRYRLQLAEVAAQRMLFSCGGTSDGFGTADPALEPALRSLPWNPRWAPCPPLCFPPAPAVSANLRGTPEDAALWCQCGSCMQAS
ncbi:hypothetical protein O181_025260 [Austropuccinia psidii MF-1]|uniref:Uncharacterized protein n=1 Tax=Austropuccinia psidii MF-1 TaxID=1389203 RepID=A0A9Q3H0Y6_9BASI|nr:hypothetical protein [Austropuccinia psidii MF-1]